MADKRMFSKQIIDSDAFLEMPATARLLYYDLAMRADDDGFVNSPKKIMRIIGASNDDLSILTLRNFIIPFESGVVVIKHWRIHNYIRKDTYHETNYTEEKAMLDVKENKAYTLKNGETKEIVDESWTSRGRSIDKIREDKISKEKEIYKEKETPVRNQIPPTVEMVKAYCLERGNSVDAEKFIDFYESKNWYVGKNKMKDWQASIRTWEKSDRAVTEKDKTISDMRDMLSDMSPEEYAEMERKFR